MCCFGNVMASRIGMVIVTQKISSRRPTMFVSDPGCSPTNCSRGFVNRLVRSFVCFVLPLPELDLAKSITERSRVVRLGAVSSGCSLLLGCAKNDDDNSFSQNETLHHHYNSSSHCHTHPVPSSIRPITKLSDHLTDLPFRD